MSLPQSVERVSIELAERSYPILIGTGLLGAVQTYADLPKGSSAMIVTSVTVAPLYAASLQHALGKHYKKIHLLVLPDGEMHKTWITLNFIFDALLQNQCDRKTVFLSLIHI